MSKQVHLEMIVELSDENSLVDVYLNDEDSGTWWQGHTYDTTLDEWVEDDFDQLERAARIAEHILRKGY